MKKHYTLAKTILAGAFAALLSAAGAQHTNYLNVNNVRAGIGSGGNLFSQIGNPNPAWQLFEAPAGSGIVPIYTASIWMSGYDTGNNLHVAAQRYAEHGHDFYNGPIVSNYTADYDTFFNQVFKVTRLQISHHQSLGSPLTTAQIDTAILMWPAKGNPFISIATGINIGSRLAPFVDVDNDQVYDPRKGDYPDVCGDEAIFFVFNDDRDIHQETGGQKLGVEVRGLAQAYYYGNSPVSNTIFVSYEVENKSQSRYNDFYMSMFEDADLGCFANDRVGCDVPMALMYTYNGQAYDADCNGVKGYANKSAATGVKLLRGGFSSFGYFLNGNPAGLDDPSNAAGFRNYQTAHWNDGTPFGDGQNGYGGNPSKYIFPGRPATPTDFTDEASGLPAGDRRILGTSDSSDFLSGEIKKFDYAFFTTLDSTATNLTIVDSLKRDAAQIQGFYNSNFLGCLANPFTPTAINAVNNDLQLLVYPNPASSSLMLEAEEAIDRVELTDMLGRTVLAKTANGTRVLLNVATLPAGVYLIKIKAGNKTTTKKIVIE